MAFFDVTTMGKIVELLLLDDFSEVFKEANKVKIENVGEKIQVRGILEFSNYCKCPCKYCGLNCTNKKVKRYRMSSEEIVASAMKAYEEGYETIVLQSGEDPFFTIDILGDIVKKIKSTCIAITISCGEMGYSDLNYLKKCGADRYLLKHETADPKLYEELHCGLKLEDRVACLKDIKKLGYETGSGFMIGLPGQTIKTIAMDLLLLKEIGCDMAGIGPFIPHPDTPLFNTPHGSTDMTKRAVALARLMLPKCNLPATTSLGVLDKNEKDDVFSCGANVIMYKITPQKYRKLYEIYPTE